MLIMEMVRLKVIAFIYGFSLAKPAEYVKFKMIKFKIKNLDLI